MSDRGRPDPHRPSALDVRASCWMLLVGLAAMQLARAVPPPPEQSFVDCAAPVYAADATVCSHPELLALERRLRELAGRFDIDAVTAMDAGVESQSQWFRRRALCAFASAQDVCLRAMYLDRIAVLEALRPAAPAP